MSDAEKSVLEVFRRYLLAPGKMLCFYGQDLEKLREPLAQLTEKQLLVAESFRGAYSLTEAGFSAMQDCGGQDEGSAATVAAEPRRKP